MADPEIEDILSSMAAKLETLEERFDALTDILIARGVITPGDVPGVE